MNTLSKIQKLPKQPLAAIAYETIVRKIICLEYQPSQHLEESQLVEDLGIGRTPIREALVRLHGEKMVESHPNRGVIVRPITLLNTKSMFESMNLMEIGLVDIAVSKDCSHFIREMKTANEKVQRAIQANDVFDLVEANHEFHMKFAHCSQNEFLVRAVGDVRAEAKRLSYLSYNNIIDPKKPIQAHYDVVFQEHEKIIEALSKKNVTALKKLIEDHIRTFRQRIIVFMTS